MREVVDRARILRVMDAFGDAAGQEVRAYLVGGTTAVLLGWRTATIDIDFVLQPEDEALLRAIPMLKETLRVNMETASPVDFIPVPAGWEDRSTFIAQVRRVAFYHFDLYAQAMAKIERGHQKDIADVNAMLSRGLIDRDRAVEYFARVEPELYRYPAIDPPSFRRAVNSLLQA